MVPYEVVDPFERPEDKRRRRWFQVLLPITTVLLILLSIAGIGWHSWKTTQQGTFELTRRLLDMVQKYVVQDVEEYLGSATIGAYFARDFLAHAAPDALKQDFDDYGSSMLRLVPQLQSFYVAGEDGSFMLIERDPNGDGMEYTTLTVKDGAGIFHHDFYDASGKFLRSEENPSDGYDPRKRSWFHDAMQVNGLTWSAPTLYEATKHLVITSSAAFTGRDGMQRVFAVNTSLDQLSSFLTKLHVSQGSRAVIVDEHGHIIAAPEFDRLEEKSGGDPSRMTLQLFGDEKFVKMYDHYRVNGKGTWHFTAGKDKKGYIGISQPLPQTAGWILLISSPESDFAGFIRRNGRQSLMFAMIVVFLATILAGLLAAQSRKTERARRKITRMTEQDQMESIALQAVASTRDLFDTSSGAFVLTEQLATVAQARRCAVWQFLKKNTVLVCDDIYDSTLDSHSGGSELTVSDCKAFFELVSSGVSAEIVSAAADDRTRGFERLVMREARTSRLLVCPVVGGDGVLGVITIEDSAADHDLESFIGMMAAIVAMRFDHVKEEASTEPGEKQDLLTSGPHHPVRFEDDFLGARNASEIQEAACLYKEVAVMVISFTDPFMESSANPDTVLALINRIACAGQDIARQHDLFSIKLAGHRLICVAGCSGKAEPDAIIRIAEAALAFREACVAVLAEANIEPIFSIGIDFGPAFGGELGKDPTIFNLWGETVTFAELMAQDAADVGTIEVSEPVYMALRDRYLFRSRGAFYTPRSGAGQIYVLVTRR